MKYSNPIALAIAAVCGLAASGHASDTVIVNDTWADGDRTSSGADGSGIDSPWYSSTGASLTAATGSMTATVASASSLTFWTYFEPSGSPVQLAVGDTLQITFGFNVSGVGAQNTSRGFNFGLFDSSGGTRRTTDGGSPVGTGVTGYRQAMNFGSTFGVANALQTQKRTTVSDANLLSTSGDYTTVGTTGGGNAVADPAFSASVSYTTVVAITRTSSTSLSLTTTISGSSLNGGTITQTVTDSSSPTFNFDTFALRPTTGATTATGFNFTQFKVEDITVDAVPEPSMFALSGLGLFAWAGYRRLKK